MTIPGTDYDEAALVNPISAMTDFTLYIDLSRMSASWWAEVDTSDGTMGRASKGDGTTELACDWIDFNDTAETGYLRVKWSGTLASSGTQEVRVWPPLVANGTVAATATYGSDNAYDDDWVAYLPCSSSSMIDRTKNGYDFTLKSGHTITFTAPLGGGTARFGNVYTATKTADNYAYYDGAGTDVFSAFPVFMNHWIYGDPFLNTSSTVSIADTPHSANPALRFQMYIYKGGTSLGVMRKEWKVPLGSARRHSSCTAVLADSELWQNYSGRIDASSQSGFMNGVACSGSQGITDSFPTGFDSMVIGLPNYGPNGQLAECQWHKADRVADWVNKEFLQVDDNPTMWGTWENSGGAPATRRVMMIE